MYLKNKNFSKNLQQSYIYTTNMWEDDNPGLRHKQSDLKCNFLHLNIQFVKKKTHQTKILNIAHNKEV